MKTNILALLTIVLVSCNGSKKIEEILIANPNEFWAYYNPNSADLIYFKFEKNKHTSRYERDNKNRFYKYKGEGDVIESSRKWIVSKDSILIFNGSAYDVVSSNNEVIVLYYMDKESHNERMIFLTKEKENQPRKYSGFFGQKRIDQPKKYNVPEGW
nr:hypothetical protein [uncultured Flavobacterium sp.]